MGGSGALRPRLRLPVATVGEKVQRTGITERATAGCPNKYFSQPALTTDRWLLDFFLFLALLALHFLLPSSVSFASSLAPALLVPPVTTIAKMPSMWLTDMQSRVAERAEEEHD